MLQRRRFALRALVFALVLLMVATAGASAAKVIRYAHFQPAALDQPKHAAALAFKSYVEALTNGELQVTIYPASQLGDAEVVLEGLQLGTVQLAVVHDGPIAGVYPPFQVFNIPFLFNDKAEQWAVFDGSFTKDLGEAMRQQTGIRMLALADNGVRHFTNDVRPIRSPADLRGLKIRVQPGPLYLELVRAFDAGPSAISWPELPAALQQKVVDGQENSVTNILAADLHQTQRYVTLDSHIYSVHAYLINDAFFQGLTAEEQSIVERGIEIAKWIHRGMTAAEDMNAETILQDLGMQVTTLSADEVAAFRDVAQAPVVRWLTTEVDQSWVDGIFQAVEDARD